MYFQQDNEQRNLGKTFLSFFNQDPKGRCYSLPMLHIAVIGGGLNSAVGRAHLSALNLDGNWKIKSGFFSRNLDVNVASAKLWNAAQMYSSMDEFLNSNLNDLDAVLVLTPTPSHYDLVLKLIDNKVNVICEKSLSTSSQKALSLMETSLATFTKLFVTFNYTGYPMVREIRSRIQSGIYGEIHSIFVDMPQDGFAVVDASGAPKKIQNWRHSDYEIPTVSLDLGVHVNNIAHFLLGDSQEKVVSIENHFGKIENTIDTVNYLCKFSTGTVGNFSFGKTFLGIRNGLSFSIFGKNGSAQWNQSMPDQFWESNSMGRLRMIDLSDEELQVANQSRYMRFKAGHPTGFIEAFSNMYKDIENNLLNVESNNGSDYTFTGFHAAQGLKELEAVHLSARANEWVDVT
jgi:predicted dehydrogenase